MMTLHENFDNNIKRIRTMLYFYSKRKIINQIYFFKTRLKIKSVQTFSKKKTGFNLASSEKIKVGNTYN